MNYTLITGASSGIGYELARVFARHNHNLVLVARSTGKLEALRSELTKDFSVRAEVISLDLARAGAAEELAEFLRRKKLDVDVLVNNAGFGDHSLFLQQDQQKIEEMILLNVLTLTKLTRLLLPDMVLRKGGKILNVASTAAFQPGPLMSVYYATKAYVLSFSEGLYEELRGTGVSVTALCPGPTESGFQNAANMSDIALVETMKLPTSKDVAEFGYRALMANRAVAVHGLVNSVMAASTGLAPRFLVRKLVKKLQEKRN